MPCRRDLRWKRLEADIPAIAEVTCRAFAGTISEDLFGRESLRETKKGLKVNFALYAGTGSLDLCSVARKIGDNQIIGACVAGISPRMPNLFAFIVDVFVLPEYRGRGLGEAMLRRAIAAAPRKRR